MKEQEINLEFERILDTYDKKTLIMFLEEKYNLEEKENFIKEFKDEQ